jgi:hypothetical protein
MTLEQELILENVLSSNALVWIPYPLLLLQVTSF